MEVILRNAVDPQFAPGSKATRHRARPGSRTRSAERCLAPASSPDDRRISREGKAPTRGRVVAGLPFGFWRALFDKKYDGLWVSDLHRAFPAG